MKGPRTDRKGQNHILKQWSPILVKVPFPQHQDFFFGSFICHFQPYILSRYSFPNFTFNPQRREQPRLRIASLRNYIFLRHPIILKMTTYRPWSINNAKSMKQLAQIIVAVTLLASRKARRAVSLTANIYLRLVMPITAIMMSPGCKMPHQHCSLGLKVGIKLPDFNMSLRSHYLVQLLSFSCVFRCLLFHPLLNLVVLYNISRFFFNAAFMPSERRLKKKVLVLCIFYFFEIYCGAMVHAPCIVELLPRLLTNGPVRSFGSSTVGHIGRCRILAYFGLSFIYTCLPSWFNSGLLQFTYIHMIRGPAIFRPGTVLFATVNPCLDCRLWLFWDNSAKRYAPAPNIYTICLILCSEAVPISGNTSRGSTNMNAEGICFSCILTETVRVLQGWWRRVRMSL